MQYITYKLSEAEIVKTISAFLTVLQNWAKGILLPTVVDISFRYLLIIW